MTVRVISHGPISLKIVVLLLGDTLLKFQYIEKIHKIFEKFTKYWNDSQNIGIIHKILEWFTKYWNDSQNIGVIHKILEILEWFTKFWNNSQNVGVVRIDQFYEILKSQKVLNSLEKTLKDSKSV